jgi:hypothetical protein
MAYFVYRQPAPPGVTTEGHIMTNFVLAPSATWDPQSGYASPRTMLEQGMLRAYTLRESGIMRHLELAPLGSTRRDTAEWISEEMNDGRSVKAIARELHTSVATVRRLLLSLELTEQVEADEWEDLGFDATGEPVWDSASTTEDVTQEDDSLEDALQDSLNAQDEKAFMAALTVTPTTP